MEAASTAILCLEFWTFIFGFPKTYPAAENCNFLKIVYLIAMKLKSLLTVAAIAALSLPACQKKQAEDARDHADAQTEEIKKDVAKTTNDLEVKAKELAKTAEKKADELNKEAAPKIEELKKEGAQKLDEAKAAIHDATAPTPTPAATTPPDASPTPSSMQ